MAWRNNNKPVEVQPAFSLFDTLIKIKTYEQTKRIADEMERQNRYLNEDEETAAARRRLRALRGC